MLLLEKTYQQQSSLARFCRTGKYSPLEGVKEKHVPQYRRLIYNVIDDSLQSAYPLAYNLLTTNEWKNLVTAFFQEHDCYSPQVWYMPRELYEFVSETDSKLKKKYPFLVELLLFEWLEVEVYMMEDQTVDFKELGNIEKDRLVINPEHRLQHFHYPVHLKNAKFISLTDKADYFLVLHRDPDSGSVCFTNLSPAFVRMVELLNEQPSTMNEVMFRACHELEVQPNKEITTATQSFFQHAFTSKLILGFK